MVAVAHLRLSYALLRLSYAPSKAGELHQKIAHVYACKTVIQCKGFKWEG